MHFDQMYIPMDKIKEDKNYVWYKIVINEITNEIKLDKKGRKINIIKPHYGVFKFKKDSFEDPIGINFKVENIITFIENETDTLLLNTLKNQILAKCLVVMDKHLKEGFFPDKTSYISG